MLASSVLCNLFFFLFLQLPTITYTSLESTRVQLRYRAKSISTLSLWWVDSSSLWHASTSHTLWCMMNLKNVWGENMVANSLSQRDFFSIFLTNLNLLALCVTRHRASWTPHAMSSSQQLAQLNMLKRKQWKIVYRQWPMTGWAGVSSENNGREKAMEKAKKSVCQTQKKSAIELFSSQRALVRAQIFPIFQAFCLKMLKSARREKCGERENILTQIVRQQRLAAVRGLWTTRSTR